MSYCVFNCAAIFSSQSSFDAYHSKNMLDMAEFASRSAATAAEEKTNSPSSVKVKSSASSAALIDRKTSKANVISPRGASSAVASPREAKPAAPSPAKNMPAKFRLVYLLWIEFCWWIVL